MEIGFVGIAVIVGIVLIWFWNSIYIIKEWERGVVLRLGRLLPEAKGAGIRLVMWPIETLYRISLRLETLDVPPQDIITRDNVSVKVNAVCYFRVVDANLALSQVQNYQYATSQLAQTTLRSVVGQFELDEILSRSEERRVGKECVDRARQHDSSRRRHTRLVSDWSSDVCSSDLAARHHHARQRLGKSERRVLFPRCGREPRALPGAELSVRDVAVGADHAAQRSRAIRIGRNPLATRKSERQAAGDSGPGHRAVGHQSHQSRSETGRHPRADAARHRQAGGS